LLAVAFVAWCQLLACQANADESHPLQPIDTSSPRATLQGFLETTNEGHAASSRLRQSYWSSSRLYFLPEEIATMRYALSRVESSERTLDLSELPSATIRESSRRLVVQLKEILDRIDLPPMESVPDEQAMAKAEFKRWTLPGTEIRIARIEQGPRTGEYLFTPETVGRIPEFYLKAKNLPYKPGASIGWYDLIMNSPTGVVIALHSLVPPRWVFSAAVGMQATFLDQPLWRWVSIAAVLATGWAFIVLCHHLSRRWAVGQWTHLLLPLGVTLVASTMVPILAEVLRVSGFVYHAATLLLWTAFYLALTWAVWVVGSVAAESVIAHEKLRTSSIDSQLIRLALRLLTIVLAIAILVTGADRVGLPAYSVIAGLGVGGLAVALAAQQTIANLLGSIIIMIEKPFAIGHWIKVEDIEGIVEDVGFRSTRIRTFYDSLVTIPSSQMVSSTVDNMELRQFRQVKTVLSLTYDTPTEKIKGFVEGVRRIIQAHPDTRKDNIQVVFNNFGPCSLDILMNFFVNVPDKMTELIERQRIFFDILCLAEAMEVRFAFPTQTLHIESLPVEMRSIGDGPMPSSQATPARL
jgi:MscS family membrane protein